MLVLPTGPELLAILPEIILVLGMCAALLVPLVPPFQRAARESHAPMYWVALLTLVAATLSAAAIAGEAFGMTIPDGYVLFGMFAVDRFALTFKVILYVFTIFVLFLFNTTTRDQVRTLDSPDYISLILGSVLGMSMMASASNFLIIFLAIETASFPSFALAGFYKTSRRGSEASMKYVLFGAASSAMMLYGLSLLYGTYGTLNLSEVAQTVGANGMTAGLWIGIVGLMIGIGFKLSAVPMHFWCPDVFEGAPFEITTFLSVVSKGAAVVLLLRIMLTFGVFSTPEHSGTFAGISAFVGFIGLVTATWGNLAAYFQANIKRLLAFSSIAHAGYMIMAAAMLTASSNASGGPTSGQELAYAILFYLIVYCCMNYGAFYIAAIVARETGSEMLDDYAGMGARNPALAIMLGCFLLALFGMPGTGGFLGKVYLGFQMWKQGAWWFVAGLVINTVFSLYIYLKPIIIMVWKDAAGRPAVQANPVRMALLAVALFGIFATGILPDQATGWARTNAVLTYDRYLTVDGEFSGQARPDAEAEARTDERGRTAIGVDAKREVEIEAEAGEDLASAQPADAPSRGLPNRLRKEGER